MACRVGHSGRAGMGRMTSRRALLSCLGPFANVRIGLWGPVSRILNLTDCFR